MKLFLDTSSLFKLYYKENDSYVIEDLFSDFEIKEIILSELCKVEFQSTVWKKIRVKEISTPQCDAILEAFELDMSKYVFVQIDKFIIETAKDLLKKYGVLGLRTLDSIQLATAVSLKNKVDLFHSSDELLTSFMKLEGLITGH